MTRALALQIAAFWLVTSALIGPTAFGPDVEAGLLRPWHLAGPMLALLVVGCALHALARLA